MSDNKKAVNFLTDSLYDETPAESQTARSFFTSGLSFRLHVACCFLNLWRLSLLIYTMYIYMYAILLRVSINFRHCCLIDATL